MVLILIRVVYCNDAYSNTCGVLQWWLFSYVWCIVMVFIQVPHPPPPHPKKEDRSNKTDVFVLVVIVVMWGRRVCIFLPDCLLLLLWFFNATRNDYNERLFNKILTSFPPFPALLSSQAALFAVRLETRRHRERNLSYVRLFEGWVNIGSGLRLTFSPSPAKKARGTERGLCAGHWNRTLNVFFFSFFSRSSLQVSPLGQAFARAKCLRISEIPH